MEKLQLVNFIAKVMEESGFKVYKNFKTSQRIIDIYGVLPTVMGDFGVVVACKNYDKQWEVGIDILKDMEMTGRSLKASKVAIVTSSTFSSQSRSYGSKKNIKLVDRDNLISLAKKFSKRGASLANGNRPVSNSNIESDYKNQTVANDNSPSLNTTNEDYNNPHDNDYDEKYLDSYSTGNYPSSSNLHRDRDVDSSRVKTPNFKNSNLGKSNSKVSSMKSNSILNKQKRKEPGPPLSSRLKPIFNNTIVLILIVVAVSYLISLIFIGTSNASRGISGLVKIMSSLLLSYGLVFALNKEGTKVLVKGSIIFFVSLVILILIIILL
ncbi:restriction endonuclease [Methanobrevibacter cuticularis]|uniref:Restriction endonuclease n=1 Tax=Methanobrevibacter cuticularis TaxID=47311 RepID=A0A166D2Q6_9EURY|nr:restriction endonuclease [Methanobrevibacter cuticularis]KZX15149.1 restriction endonuclease [Methanobrevibacter cuticularis]